MCQKAYSKAHVLQRIGNLTLTILVRGRKMFSNLQHPQILASMRHSLPLILVLLHLVQRCRVRQRCLTAMFKMALSQGPLITILKRRCLNTPLLHQRPKPITAYHPYNHLRILVMTQNVALLFQISIQILALMMAALWLQMQPITQLQELPRHSHICTMKLRRTLPPLRFTTTHTFESGL